MPAFPLKVSASPNQSPPIVLQIRTHTHDLADNFGDRGNTTLHNPTVSLYPPESLVEPDL